MALAYLPLSSPCFVRLPVLRFGIERAVNRPLAAGLLAVDEFKYLGFLGVLARRQSATLDRFIYAIVRLLLQLEPPRCSAQSNHRADATKAAPVRHP